MNTELQKGALVTGAARGIGLETELAEAIFFLCNDRASYMTGQTIAVDGGFETTGTGLPAMREDKRNG